MTNIELIQISTYKNNGQRAEQNFRYTVTGLIEKADNIAHTVSGDCNGTQIKSARATICKGLDLIAYLATDAAENFAYVTADCKTAYIMTKAEYIAFCTAFATVTRDSEKNGGGLKMRLKSESAAMRAWLSAKA